MDYFEMVPEDIEIRPPYYLTAYGLAVKHGYVGTEEEWLASLHGTGAYEAAVAAGYEGTEEEFYQELADAAEAKAAAEEAQEAAENARDAAITAQGKAEDAQDAAEDAQTAAEGAQANAEAWATGSTGGTPGETNNAEYYAGQAEAWATGGSGGTPSATNNAQYFFGAAMEAAGSAEGSAQSAAGAAQTATDKAAEANASAAAAEDAQIAAAGSAQSASSDAASAGTSATAAETSAGTAVSAKEASQTAQTAAEAAQTAAEAAQTAAETAAEEAEEIVAVTLAAFPTDSASGNPATFDDGADAIPVKSLVATIPFMPYTIMPGWYLDERTNTYRPTYSGSITNRTIIFKAKPSTTYTITSGIPGTMRAIATTDYPALGMGYSNRARAEDNVNPVSVEITTTALQTWITVQFFIEDDVTYRSATIEAALAGWSTSPVLSFGNLTITANGEAVTADWSAQGEIYGGTVDFTNGVVTGTVDNTGAELDPPVVYDIDPIPVASVYGNNSISSEVGSLAVQYRADIALYIAKKISEIPSASGVSF